MRTSVTALRAPSSLKLLLTMTLAVGLLVPVMSPAGADAPRRAAGSCRADALFYDDGALPDSTMLAAGNGDAGRALISSAAYAQGGPDSHPFELVSAAKPSLTRARLDAMEHRGVRAAYFAGWRAQQRKQTRRLVARVEACPDEAQVLIGYSQGAVVLRAMLRDLTRTAKGRDILNRIAGVVLIGDPAADRREKIKRYGGAKRSGVIAPRIPLPRALVARGLVTSVCAANDPVCSSTPKTRKGKPTKAAGRKAVRSHLAYDLGRGRQVIDTAAERAVVAMTRQLLARYAARPSWQEVCARSSDTPARPCYARREGDAFSASESTRGGYRIAPAATTLPAGVALAADLTLSGVVPDSGHDDVVIGFTSPKVAPAVVRRAHLSLGSWPRQTARPGVRRISHALSGGAANGASSQPDVSADGQHVAFVSLASDLVAGDTNGAGLDVFVWDRATDTTKRLAVGDASTAWPDVSADGRFVAFTTTSPLAGDTDALADVFVWDTQTGAVQLASPGTAAPVSAGSITPDGSTVFFREDPSGTAELGNVVRRWTRAEGSVVSVPSPAGWAWTVDPNNPRPWASSPDGRFVVVQSTTGAQAAVWDRQADAQHGVGCGSRYLGGAIRGYNAAVAADGSVFSFADHLNGVRDPIASRAVCDTAAGERADYALSTEFAFTADGDLEISNAQNWYERSLPELRNRVTDARTVPTVEGTQADGESGQLASVTGDASTVAFAARAKNIVETDPGNFGRSEVYLWDRTVSP